MEVDNADIVSAMLMEIHYRKSELKKFETWSDGYSVDGWTGDTGSLPLHVESTNWSYRSCCMGVYYVQNAS